MQYSGKLTKLIVPDCLSTLPNSTTSINITWQLPDAVGNLIIRLVQVQGSFEVLLVLGCGSHRPKLITTGQWQSFAALPGLTPKQCLVYDSCTTGNANTVVSSLLFMFCHVVCDIPCLSNPVTQNILHTNMEWKRAFYYQYCTNTVSSGRNTALSSVSVTADSVRYHGSYDSGFVIAASLGSDKVRNITYHVDHWRRGDSPDIDIYLDWPSRTGQYFMSMFLAWFH